MLNETEIERIAHATNALRPDWPVPSLRTLIATKLRHKARKDVAVALTWIACDPTTKTPARALEAGPWWTSFGAETPRGPKRGEDCPKHPGQFPHTCSGCTADRLEHQPAPPRATSTPPIDAYRAARGKP